MSDSPSLVCESVSPADPHAARSRAKVLPLSLIALGVVFGDIGTSPLYAFKECLQHGAGPGDIYGVVSLILWSLILLVSVKYVGIILRADNNGEGGILALLALAFPEKEERAAPRLAAVMIILAE
jgi:KUP system potassium uptake protein